MQRKRGLFVVLDGPDGCGKTTQAGRLAEALTALGRRVLHVRDPGSTRLAEALRRVLLDHASGELSVGAETMLYVAARAQLVAEVVEPALASGTDVVCERWSLSTEVYQGHAGKFGVERVRKLLDLAITTSPDLVLVLDVPGRAGRLGAPRDASDLQQNLLFEEAFRDRMESKDRKFQDAVVRGFRLLAKNRAGHVIVAPGTLDEVAARILGRVRELAG